MIRRLFSLLFTLFCTWLSVYSVTVVFGWILGSIVGLFFLTIIVYLVASWIVDSQYVFRLWYTTRK